MSDVEDVDFDSDPNYKPSFVLIAIDTHPSMFVKTKKESQDEPTSFFQDCIKALYDLADSLIFTQNKRSWSPFAITLAQKDDLASFVNFKDSILDTIKMLKAKNQESNEDLINSYQRKVNFDLGAFLLLCKKKFKEISSIYYKRTIIYITNDDNPANDKNQRFAALNEAKNFEADDINFQLVTSKNDFNYSLFYNELYAVMKQDLVENLVEDVEGLFEKLSSSIVKRYYQRKLNFFPFLGDEKRFMRIVQKNFVQPFRLYNNAHMYRDDNGEDKVAKKINKTEVEAPKVFKLDFAGRSLEFDLQESVEMKRNNLPVGYSLIDVSDRVTEIGAVLSNSHVIEADFKDNLNFFGSFWQYCVDNDKVLICVRKLKHLDKIRFVELIPKFANNSRIFITKAIPFANEVKNPPTNFNGECPDKYSLDKVEITNQIIDKLTFDYDPKMFPNPSIASKKAYCKSKLLGETPEEVEDVTLDREAIDSQIGQVGEKFKAVFQLDAAPTNKRKAASTTRGRAKKAK